MEDEGEAVKVPSQMSGLYRDTQESQEEERGAH